MPLGWLAGGQSLKPLPLPPQDRFVLHSSPGDGKQMVLDGEGEVTKEAGDLLPTNLLVGGGGRCDGVSESSQGMQPAGSSPKMKG